MKYRYLSKKAVRMTTLRSIIQKMPGNRSCYRYSRSRRTSRQDQTESILSSYITHQKRWLTHSRCSSISQSQLLKVNSPTTGSKLTYHRFTRREPDARNEAGIHMKFAIQAWSPYLRECLEKDHHLATKLAKKLKTWAMKRDCKLGLTTLADRRLT